MNIKGYKIADIIFCVIWCIFWSIRMHYPRNYPPLDGFGFAFMILLIIDEVIVGRKKIYSKNVWPIEIVKSILIVGPLIYGLILALVLK